MARRAKTNPKRITTIHPADYRSSNTVSMHCLAEVEVLLFTACSSLQPQTNSISLFSHIRSNHYVARLLTTKSSWCSSPQSPNLPLQRARPQNEANQSKSEIMKISKQFAVEIDRKLKIQKKRPCNRPKADLMLRWTSLFKKDQIDEIFTKSYNI
jgi:hypothetical protein